MGQETTKLTTYHRQHLEHAPTVEVPGTPKLVHAQALPNPLAKTDPQEHPLVEVYLLDLFLNQEEVAVACKTYKQRSRGLPWHVRVLSFAMYKSPCYCSDSKMSTVVVTEHIHARLSNFQVNKGPSLHKYKEYQHYPSLSTNESIYLLLNVLQGYQHLYQDYNIQWPTFNSIGVTEKGVVKVWICQNWAINAEHHCKLPETAVIEQILQLVLERTEGTELQEVVRSRGNSFQTIQNLLGEFVIEYNMGRKSLSETIIRGSKVREDRKKQAPQAKGELIKKKHSLSKLGRSEQERQRIKEQVQPKIVESKIVRVEGERRYQSHEAVPKVSKPEVGFPLSWIQQRQDFSKAFSKINENPRKPAGSTANTTTRNSPIKQIKFTYDQSPRSPPPSQKRTQRSPVQQIQSQLPFPLQFSIKYKEHPLIAITRQQSPFPKHQPQPAINPFKTELILQHKAFPSPFHKISLPTPSQTPLKQSGQMKHEVEGQVVGLGEIEQVQSTKTIKKEEQSSKVVIVGKTDKSVQFKSIQLSEEESHKTHEEQFVLTPLSKQPMGSGSEHKTPEGPNESISDLTSQFRLLLQSDKQIENSLSDISLSECSGMQAESESYVSSQEQLGGHIYSIKQVDEEVSYSVQENK